MTFALLFFGGWFLLMLGLIAYLSDFDERGRP